MRPFAFSLLLFAATLGAQVEFDPPYVTSRTAATVRISAGWQNSCVPRLREVNVSGSTIEVRLFVPSGFICQSAVSPWSEEVYLGVLSAGVYDVVFLVDAFGTRSVITQTTLAVAEAGLPWTFTPRAVTTFGRMEVIADHVDTSSPPQVLVDGRPPANIRIIDHDTFAFIPPPHEPGAVDVVINGVRAKAALRHYDPDAARPDPAIFEPVLIPLLFSGGGQFGSQWTTEAWVRNESGRPVEPWRQYFGACLAAVGQPCPFPPGAVLRTHVEQRPGGLVLYVPRDQSSQLTFSVLVKDLSRQAQTLGTSIPVVREGDWRRSPFSILNVPPNPRYRHTLRIYAVDRLGATVGVTFHSMTTGLEIAPPETVTLRSNGADEPANATVSVPLLQGSDPVRIGIVTPFPGAFPPGRFWAFVSTTNNETQHVTVLSPE